MFAQTTLIGRLGKDPETRAMPSGASVTNFSMATSEKWTDKQSGEKQEHTEWHNVAVFGKMADVAAKYLSKGDLVTIIGRPRTDKVEGRDGTTKYFTKVIADKLVLMPNEGRAEAPAEGDDTAEPAGDGAEGFDDSIPF